MIETPVILHYLLICYTDKLYNWFQM